ncbi:HEAT repeat domain-containing protein [bacterium]|nr:MAG: HEAT repeat domain-containing protein [bacterium]
MNKKRRLLLGVLFVIALIAVIMIGSYRVLCISSETIDNFLIKIEAEAQEDKINQIVIEQGETEANRIKEAQENAENSKLVTQGNPEVTSTDITKSRSYKKAWGSINAINRVALWLKSREGVEADDPSDLNGGILDGIFYAGPMIYSNTFNNLLELEADGVYYASMEALYDPDISWEAKYFIVQILGNREERRALPVFREIIQDEDEAILVRITAIDQISGLEDHESNDLILSFLDDKLPVMRKKASTALRGTAEKGDMHTYSKVVSRYWAEDDSEVKSCLVGTMIVVGQEESFQDVEKILETAIDEERITIIGNLQDIHTLESFGILKKLYDPKDENIAIFTVSSMARLELPEANEFLCDIVKEANGIISIMAAGSLVEYKQTGAIRYIEEALKKEKDPEFIDSYQRKLKELQELKELK